MEEWNSLAKAGTVTSLSTHDPTQTELVIPACKWQSLGKNSTSTVTRKETFRGCFACWLWQCLLYCVAQDAPDLVIVLPSPLLC